MKKAEKTDQLKTEQVWDYLSQKFYLDETFFINAYNILISNNT